MGYFVKQNNRDNREVKNQNDVNHMSNMLDLPLTSKDKDLLNINSYQDGLIDYIKNADMPIAIAIQGDWGSGKTSLMNAFYDKLCKYNDSLFFGIRINTWQYSLLSTTQQAIIDILKSIIKQINTFQPDKELGNKVIDEAIRTIVVGAKFAYDVADQIYLNGILKKSGWDSEKLHKSFVYIKNGSANSSKDNKDNADKMTDSATVEHLKKEIYRLVRYALIINNKCCDCNDEDCEYKAIANNCWHGGKKKGFIFFVDDLDRIDPSLAIEILEIIKNLFDLPYCMFVLAVDYSVIVKGLEPKLGELKSDNAYKFRRYFDKLIQLPISIPTELYSLQSLLEHGLSDVGFLNNELARDDEFILKLSEIAEKSIGKNPRYVKRLINSLSLVDRIVSKNIEAAASDFDKLLDVNKLKSNKEYVTLVFALVCIQIAYPFVYKLILKYPDITSWSNDLASWLGAPDVDYNVLLTMRQIEKKACYHLEFPSECQCWEKVLFRICNIDSYLRENFFNILVILNEVIAIGEKKGWRVADNIWRSVMSVLLITDINTSLT